MDEEVNNEKQLSPLADAIEKLYLENADLKVQLEEIKLYNEKLLVRERCYQSELTKVRNSLQKLAQSIDTAPHARAEEYQKYYGE